MQASSITLFGLVRFLLVAALVVVGFTAVAEVSGVTPPGVRIGPGVREFTGLERRSPVVVRVPTGEVPEVLGHHPGLRPGVELHRDGVVEVWVARPTTGQYALYAVSRLAVPLAVVVVLLLLLRTLRAARRDEPFRASVVRRLYVVSGVAYVLGTAATLAEAVALGALGESVTHGGFVLAWRPVDAFLVALVLLVTAEIVRRGTALREELAGVV